MTAPAKQDSSTSATPTFYQLLQFDARGLWAKIRATDIPREKRRYFLAMAVRSLLLVAFAILFIGVLTAVFGNENSGVVVAGFCILLGIKFAMNESAGEPASVTRPPTSMQANTTASAKRLSSTR